MESATVPIVRRGTPLESARVAVVMLHGRGSDAAAILELARPFERPDVVFLAPDAPSGTWYPETFLAPLVRNQPYLDQSLNTVHETVAMIMQAGIDVHHLVLIGFSQGACLASEFVARNPAPYGGVVVLSGGLIGNGSIPGAEAPLDKRFDYQGSLAGCSVFVGCSDVDAHIPLVRVQKTASTLESLGARVTLKIYPGMGHTVNSDEIESIRMLLDGLRENPL